MYYFYFVIWFLRHLPKFPTICSMGKNDQHGRINLNENNKKIWKIYGIWPKIFNFHIFCFLFLRHLPKFPTICSMGKNDQHGRIDLKGKRKFFVNFFGIGPKIWIFHIFLFFIFEAFANVSDHMFYGKKWSAWSNWLKRQKKNFCKIFWHRAKNLNFSCISSIVVRMSHDTFLDGQYLGHLWRYVAG